MSDMALRPRSFAGKITLLATAASGVAMLVVSASVALADHAELRRQTIETLRSHAEMIALNSAAPLVFGDRVHAAEAIGVLRAAPEVVGARLFDERGRVFAGWHRGSVQPIDDALSEGIHELGDWLVLSTPVLDRGEREGQLQVVYDQRPLRSRRLAALSTALLVSLAAMGLVYAAARRLAGGLTGPIDELVRTARAVSETGDDSLRARRLSDDELGDLTGAFNEMLARLEQQAGALRRAHFERESLLESERSARAEAERASRSKDEFVATLSHELRTPLTPILGWVEILRRNGAAEDPDTRQGLEVIERNVRLQSQLIEDLLDMSRIVAGRLRLDVQRVDLVEVVEAAVATVRAAAEGRGISLQTVLDAGVAPVRGDPGRLQQVLWNLLSNAIKFTGKGGHVQVALERVDSHVEITVADDGQGIAPEFLPHVFDRFRQADGSTTRRHGGLGLGLAIARQLIELHGGTIRAASEGENRGATFVVSLPVVPVVTAAVEERREHPTTPSRGLERTELPTLQGLRVLVVDDDADSRELIERMIRQWDGEVRLAESAERALELLGVERPDLLISDIGMPGVDGFDFIRQVRERAPEQGGAVPAIALTAFARAEDRTRALLAGYQLHLAKPVVPAELLAAVASLRRRA